MNISPQKLWEAFDKIQSGELSPQQAAHALLRSDPLEPHTHPALVDPTINMAQLVAQLGPPHPLIQQDWEHQIPLLIQHLHSSTGWQPAQLTISDLLVDSQNRLSLAPQFFDRWSTQLQIDNPAVADTQARTSSVSGLKTVDTSQLVPVAAPSSPSVSPPSSTKPTIRSNTRSRRWISGACVAGASCLLLIILWLLNSSSDSPPPKPTRDIAQSNRLPATQRAFDLAPNITPQMTMPAESAETSTMNDLVSSGELIQSDDQESSPSSNNDPLLHLGLDSFPGGDWQTTGDLLAAANREPVNAPVPAPESISADMDDTISSASATTDESPPATESSTPVPPATELATTVTPQSDQVSLPALRPSRAPDSVKTIPLTLTLPIHQLSLTTPEPSVFNCIQRDQVWWILAGADPIATIQAVDDQATFQWTEDAAKHPAAKQLCNARLIALSGDASSPLARQLYLRSTVVAEPFQVSFDQADSEHRWMIQDLPAISNSLWQTAWQLPATIGQQWLVPLEESAKRRQTWVCRFRLAADETVAIDTRLDWQIGTQVQLRVRHQLAFDRSASTQTAFQPPISLSQVRAAIQSCSARLISGEAMLEQLRATSARSRSSDRALISAQRERLELLMSHWEAYRDRLKLYDKLLSELQRQCYLSATLQVRWPDLPDQPQTIFHIKAADIPSKNQPTNTAKSPAAKSPVAKPMNEVEPPNDAVARPTSPSR